MDRIKTGVPGIDEMLHGGLIPKRTYLVIGGPGAGKTIFSFQFLLQGLAENEKVLYVALEEQASQLKQDMAEFGWDISRIKMLDTMQSIFSGVWALKTAQVTKPEFSLRTLVIALKQIIESYQPKRIVIDSLTSIKMLYEKEQMARRELLGFLNFLENTGCTTILTSELVGNETIVEEFLASGVIKMHLIQNSGEKIGAVSIEKMRGSSFDRHIRPLKITAKGVVVFPNEAVFR